VAIPLALALPLLVTLLKEVVVAVTFLEDAMAQVDFSDSTTNT
jgi:hypothetical protein